MLITLAQSTSLPHPQQMQSSFKALPVIRRPHTSERQRDYFSPFLSRHDWTCSLYLYLWPIWASGLFGLLWQHPKSIKHRAWTKPFQSISLQDNVNWFQATIIGTVTYQLTTQASLASPGYVSFKLIQKTIFSSAIMLTSCSCASGPLTSHDRYIYLKENTIL